MLRKVTKEEWAKFAQNSNTHLSVVRTYNNSYVTLLVNKSSYHVVGLFFNNVYFTPKKKTNLSVSFVVNNLLHVKTNNELFMLDH